jgi:uncharacterized protein YoaH (UPF0181 family)
VAALHSFGQGDFIENNQLMNNRNNYSSQQKPFPIADIFLTCRKIQKLMDRKTSNEEYMRLAAEKIRLRKEKEEREEKAFYERVTSGTPWLLFKCVVVVCTIMAVITFVEDLFDGETNALTEESWQIDRNWRYDGHAVLDVEGYMFTPNYYDWGTHIENTIRLTYTPIFKVGKVLRYDSIVNENQVVKHAVYRSRSFIGWFPFMQIFMLIPLVTLIFKRQSPWFNFARITSFVFVFPGTLMILFFAIF